MDIGKAFTFMFDDEKWITKVLVGGIFVFLSFLLIGIPFVMGYALKTLKNVIDGEPKPLPEWDELGDMFTQGLIISLVFVIYAIPVILVTCCTGIPLAIISDAGGDAADLAALLWSCFNCLISLYWLLVIVLSPAIIVRYAVTTEFAAAFRFNEIFRFISDNIGDYIIVLLLSWIATFLGGLGAVVCGVGMFFTMFWAYLVVAHLYGQLYLEADKATA